MRSGEQSPCPAEGAPSDDIRRQLAQIEAIYNSVGVGLCAFDPEGRFVRINERMAEINGVPAADHLGRTPREVAPALADQAEALLRRVIDTGQPAYDVEVTGTPHASGAGRRTWLEHWVPLKDDTGRIVGVSVVAQDITGQKQRIQNLEHDVAERTAALQMLCDVASMANRAQDVHEALAYCVRRVGEHDGWSFGHAYLPSVEDPDLLLPAYHWYAPASHRFQAFAELTRKTPLRRGQGQPGEVFESGQPRWSHDIRAALDPRRADLADALQLSTTAAFPVLAESRVVGVLQFFSEKDVEPKPELFESMATVGAQLGRVIERKTFQDRLLTLSEEEHRRIGQELHDDVGQELTGLALKAETLAEILDTQGAPASKLAREIIVALDRTRGKTRALSRGLVPSEVDGAGLEAALDELAHRIDEVGHVTCAFHCRGDRRLADTRTATQLYRIAQEAVANALGQAQTRTVDISLQCDEAAALLEISDDGPGLPPARAMGRGVGLQIMRYRAGLIGASLAVESPASGGARVICRLPNSNR